VGLKLGDVIVHTRDERLVIVVGDGLIVHVAPGQLLGQDLVEDGVLIIHDGLVDAPVGEGARRYVRTLIPLDERVHAVAAAKGEELRFQIIIICEAVVAAGRVEDPVTDIDHIQKPAELFF